MSDLSVVDLSDLGPELHEGLRALPVTDRQAFHGKSFAESMEDWSNSKRSHVLGLGFYLEAQPVGLVLFRRNGLVASVHGLKIALPWQRQGLGHQAFQIGVAEMQRQWPEVTRLKLAIDADNTAALAVYRAFGMEDSGPVQSGNHGPEHHMEIALHH